MYIKCLKSGNFIHISFYMDVRQHGYAEALTDFQEFLLAVEKQLVFYKNVERTCNYHHVFIGYHVHTRGGIVKRIQISDLRGREEIRITRDYEMRLKKEMP